MSYHGQYRHTHCHSQLRTMVNKGATGMCSSICWAQRQMICPWTRTDVSVMLGRRTRSSPRAAPGRISYYSSCYLYTQSQLSAHIYARKPFQSWSLFGPRYSIAAELSSCTRIVCANEICQNLIGVEILAPTSTIVNHSNLGRYLVRDIPSPQNSAHLLGFCLC